MAKITIPYAVSDFVEMRERGFYYVDKTRYISGLEDYKAPVSVSYTHLDVYKRQVYTIGHWRRTN